MNITKPVAYILGCCVLLSFTAMVENNLLAMNQKEEMQPKVKYTFISQRWLTEEELARFKDVHGLVLAVKMRFTNEGKDRIYYLARSTGSIIPEGYQFFRKHVEREWKYLPPSRGREGAPGSEFTGVAFTWLELPPGASIEFETFDWSNPDEEHSLSAFVKTEVGAKPVEVVSDIFRPLVRR